MLVSRSLAIVRRAIPLPLEREAALRRMAADCGLPPRDALTRIVALADDGQIARRMLHVSRKP